MISKPLRLQGLFERLVMKRLLFLLITKFGVAIALLLSSCGGTVVISITATPAPSPTPPDVTPTQEILNWVDEPYNAGADLDGEYYDIDPPVWRPNVDPQITVQVPPAWTMVGYPGYQDNAAINFQSPWPAIYKRGEGLASEVEINTSFKNGTFYWSSWAASAERFVLVIEGELNLNNVPPGVYRPDQFAWVARILPTSGHSGACDFLRLPDQSPARPYGHSSAVWLLSSPASDFQFQSGYRVPQPIFGQDSRIYIQSIEVRRVGADYGADPIEVRCGD